MSNTPIAEKDSPVEETREGDEETSWFERLLATFGLGEEPDLRELIEDALARRKAARAEKDFATSDAIRDELAAKGVEVMDGDPLGWEWRL